MSSLNISLIGAGNVGEALCLAIASAGHRIVSVASLNGITAADLALQTGAELRKDLVIPDQADLVLLTVSDRAVAEVASSLSARTDTIIAHTAGSIPLSALKGFDKAGVFYPLQTFTRGVTTDMSKVPFFVEATDKETLAVLSGLGRQIGTGAWECDSDQRKKLHVAAVFVNNFTNFMLTAGEDIAASTGLDPALLRPLMEETIRKALVAGPDKAQTGPAIRHDDSTIKTHLDLLSFSPEYQNLYRIVSEMISGYHSKTDR